jgi:peptidoglycan/xylan/chitin deacetylase (PgdA/CDA1 family)
MFLKRIMVLLGGVLLFIVSFVIYSELSHKHMEDTFRAEREKFHVDNLVLTAAEPAIAARPRPSSATEAPDTNTLIGPVPPSSSQTPDSTSATTTPAPAAAAPVPATDTSTPTPTPTPTPDTSIPATPIPASSMNYPVRSRSPFFQLASYRPSDAAAIERAEPVVSVVTNAAPAPAAAPSVPKAQPAALAPAVAPSTPKAQAAAAAPVVTPVPHTTGVAAEGSVIVLLYHQFKPAGVKIPAMYQWTMNEDVFESEMKYIHDNGYNVIPMSTLLKFLRHEGSVPPRAVCITIDDGYKSAIVYAAPILKKYGFPWTFFVYPAFITTAEGAGAASWNDLLQLQADGIDIECHSMTHPKLNSHHQLGRNLSAQEYDAWLTNETAGSKAILEQKMGKKITCFAYPFGEYNKAVEAATVAAGYEAIFTVAGNPVHSTTSLHSIGRYTITTNEEKNFTNDLRQGALGLAEAEPAPGGTTSNPRPVISAVLGFPGTLDPKSISTSVYDLEVRHDFDPQTNTVRIYMPRDLVQPVVPVNIHVKDAVSGQTMVARWHFNYEPDAAATVHTPIAPAAGVNSPVPATVATNAATAAETEPMEKKAVGTPLDTQPSAAQASPH